MFNEILLYIGAALLTVWGIAHIMPTKSIVNDFGEISDDNKRIITMEWIAEGISFIFIGVLVIIVTSFGGITSIVPIIVYLSSAVILLVMSVLSLFTGARTAIIPMKICPIIKTTVALLFIIASTVSVFPL